MLLIPSILTVRGAQANSRNTGTTLITTTDSRYTGGIHVIGHISTELKLFDASVKAAATA